MRYIIILCLCLFSCTEFHSDKQQSYPTYEILSSVDGNNSIETDTMLEKDRKPLLNPIQIDSIKSINLLIRQELASNQEIESERLLELLKLKQCYDWLCREDLVSCIRQSPVDSCKILVSEDLNSPDFKLALTKDASLIGFSNGNNMFSFNKKYPVFTLGYLAIYNIFSCIDDIYLQKNSPKIISRKEGRILCSDNIRVSVKIYYKNGWCSDSYLLGSSYLENIPQYTYSAEAQYLISVVMQIYNEYCQNIGLRTYKFLEGPMWYLK